MFTHLKAAEAWLKGVGSLPINVKFVIEGEEEVGGANLEAFMAEQPDRLACDYAVISDTSQFAPGMPAITYGLKGLAYFELIVEGADRDLHSGTYGGAVQNPLNALATILASLKDADGRIAVPGFYDDVRPLEDWERAEFAELPFSEEEFRGRPGGPRPLRRGRLHDPRTQVGPPDLRRQRPLGRLPGARPEDGAPPAGRRQVQLPPRARPDARSGSTSCSRPT